MGKPVKAKLRAGKPVVAATITSNSVDSAAHLAEAGFDFLWVEMEHSPITLETLRNIVLATRGLPAMTFARVPVNEFWTAKRVLDAGVSGVIFPVHQHAGAGRAGGRRVPVSAARAPRFGRRTRESLLAGPRSLLRFG